MIDLNRCVFCLQTCNLRDASLGAVYIDLDWIPFAIRANEAPRNLRLKDNVFRSLLCIGAHNDDAKNKQIEEPLKRRRKKLVAQSVKDRFSPMTTNRNFEEITDLRSIASPYFTKAFLEANR